MLLPVRPEQFDLATLPKMEDLISQASADDGDDAPLKRPPVTPEYLDTLRRRWAEKIPHIVATAIQEAFPGERINHVR